MKILDYISVILYWFFIGFLFVLCIDGEFPLWGLIVATVLAVLYSIGVYVRGDVEE